MKKVTLLLASTLLTLCSCSNETSSQKYYTLSFESEYGEVASIKIQFGHTLSNLPDVPECPGYDGYWAIDGQTINNESIYAYHENKVAIANYDAVSYLLSFDGTSETKRIKYNERIGELPAIPEKTGFTANSNWKIDNEEINQDTVYKWTSNKIAEVDYIVVKYKLSFENLTTVQEYTYGQVLGTLPEVPTDNDKPTNKYEYNWTIDDKIITSESTYMYYSDKMAKRLIRKIDAYECVTDTNIINNNLISVNQCVTEKDGHVNVNTDALQVLMDNKVTDIYNTGVTISWTYKTGFNVDYEYHVVEISKDQNFTNSDDIISIVTFDNKVKTEAILETCTDYYYRIKSYITNSSGERELIEESNVYAFTTPNGARTFKDPSNVIDNLRDALAYQSTIEGKKLKQGVVFRSANFDKANKDTKVFAKDLLNIKTDLDLRSESERSDLNGVSPLGNDVNYKYVSRTEGAVTYYAGQANKTGINETAETSKVSGYDALREELLVFTDQNAYPVIFHCAIGRDRTGTLNAILLALAGVSEIDIYRDYFVSTLSKAGQNDGAKASVLFESIQSVITNLISLQDGKNTQEKITNFLTKNNILTEAEISQITNNILEDR